MINRNKLAALILTIFATHQTGAFFSEGFCHLEQVIKLSDLDPSASSLNYIVNESEKEVAISFSGLSSGEISANINSQNNQLCITTPTTKISVFADPEYDKINSVLSILITEKIKLEMNTEANPDGTKKDTRIFFRESSYQSQHAVTGTMNFDALPKSKNLIEFSKKDQLLTIKLPKAAPQPVAVTIVEADDAIALKPAIVVAPAVEPVVTAPVATTNDKK